MIKKLIKKFRSLEKQIKKIDENGDNLIASQNLLKESQQIQFDYNLLSQLFSNNEFIPFTAWSISPSTILHVLYDILFNEKKNIIEFGSGSSTLYIAKFLQLQKLQNVKFYSIESDKVWIEKLENLAKQYGVLDYMHIIYSPISNVDEKLSWKEQTKWYDAEKIKVDLDINQNYDLLLVDGPWGGISPYARYSVVPFLKNNLSAEVSIYLDDTFRIEEFEIIQQWGKLLDIPVKHFNKYSLISNENCYNIEPFKLNKWMNS